jgi:hypothetical protein
MMMHRLPGPRSDDDLKDAHNCVFKQNRVTLRCNLNRIEALGESGLVLCFFLRAEPWGTAQEAEKGK